MRGGRAAGRRWRLCGSALCGVEAVPARLVRPRVARGVCPGLPFFMGNLSLSARARAFPLPKLFLG